MEGWNVVVMWENWRVFWPIWAMEGGRGNTELMTVESPIHLICNLSCGRRKREYRTDECWEFHTSNSSKFLPTFLHNQHISTSSYALQHSPVILKTEEAHSSKMSEKNSIAKCKTPQIRPSFEGKLLQTPANILFCG